MTNLKCPKGHDINMPEKSTNHKINVGVYAYNFISCQSCCRHYFEMDCIKADESLGNPEQLKNDQIKSYKIHCGCARIFSGDLLIKEENCANYGKESCVNYDPFVKIKDKNGSTTPSSPALKDVVFEKIFQKHHSELINSINEDIAKAVKDHIADAGKMVTDTNVDQSKCIFDIKYQAKFTSFEDAPMLGAGYCKTHLSWECDPLVKQYKEYKDKLTIPTPKVDNQDADLQQKSIRNPEDPALFAAAILDSIKKSCQSECEHDFTFATNPDLAVIAACKKCGNLYHGQLKKVELDFNCTNQPKQDENSTNCTTQDAQDCPRCDQECFYENRDKPLLINKDGTSWSAQQGYCLTHNFWQPCPNDKPKHTCIDKVIEALMNTIVKNESSEPGYRLLGEFYKHLIGHYPKIFNVSLDKLKELKDE